MNPLDPPPTAALPVESDIKERLQAAATELFAKKGYAAVSVREICEAAGTTKPMLYYYFGSKESLFRDLVASSFEPAYALLDAVEPRPIDEILHTFALAQLAWVSHAPDHARMVYAAILGPPEGNPARELYRLRARNTERLVEVLATAQSRGELEDDASAEDLAYDFVGTVVMACTRIMEGAPPDPLDPEARAQVLTRRFLDGARSRHPRS